MWLIFVMEMIGFAKRFWHVEVGLINSLILKKPTIEIPSNLVKGFTKCAQLCEIEGASKRHPAST